ncbi:hypothetical protein [Amycolatopsis sp. NPDC059021]|uniref:hypothetical protein n=1 Tax=Amycolatopsis sp. NPDC059021 TaxID=3346704 RepID=UPI00366F0D76
MSTSDPDPAPNRAGNGAVVALVILLVIGAGVSLLSWFYLVMADCRSGSGRSAPCMALGPGFVAGLPGLGLVAGLLVGAIGSGSALGKGRSPFRWVTIAWGIFVVATITAYLL